MKPKKYKHIEDILDEYIALSDEQIEVPLLIEKAKEKYNDLLSKHGSEIFKPGETENMFKIYTQIKKHEERREEVDAEIAEAEIVLKDFLSFLKGAKISYEKKDDTNKSKITFLFWLQNDKIMSNR